jgi:hypothetical protein
VRWAGLAGGTGVFVFGEHGAIDEIYGDRKALAELVSARGAAEAARRLVQLEIAKAPETVGPPVSVLEITKNGVRWLERGMCQGW